MQPRAEASALTRIEIRQALPEDAHIVRSILSEASVWADRQGPPMWDADEISLAVVQPDVTAGLFHLAVVDGEAVGTLKLLLADPEYWADLPASDSVFVHRLAVRRSVAGNNVATAMLTWAAERAGALGRSFLRLDCDPRRPRLRAFYERQGFRHHSDFQTRRFLVSRYEMRLVRSVEDGSSLA